MCRWLYSKGRREEAVQALSDIMDKPDHHADVVSIVNEMAHAVSVEQSDSNLSFRSIFFDKNDMKNGRRLTLCFLIQLFQQFTGINVIAFYGRDQPLGTSAPDVADTLGSHHCPRDKCWLKSGNEQLSCWLHSNCLLCWNIPADVPDGPTGPTQSTHVRIRHSVHRNGAIHRRHSACHSGHIAPRTCYADHI